MSDHNETPDDWHSGSARESFLAMEGREQLAIFGSRYPIPTLAEFGEWACQNNLQASTAVAHFLAHHHDAGRLFADMADNMNDPDGPENPWSLRVDPDERDE